VGVVPDLYLEQQLNTLPVHAVYMPLAQQAPLRVNVLLRTEGDPTGFTSVVRDEVAAMDPDLPVYGATTLRQSITDANWFFGVFGGIFATFGVAALLLAAVGLYGVMSFSVSRRTHEVGLRVALGARPGDVVRLVLRQGFVQLGIGIGVGLALAAGGGRLIGALLFEVEPTDPSIHLIIVGVLAVTGFVACFVPARRATRVDPMVAMRAE
jgi:ABC-type antimicrobial peptide transport system permease subunit